MEFSTDKKYYIVNLNSNKEKTATSLGQFIKYIDVVWGSDWLPRGKAQFEYGTISLAEYKNIIPFDEDDDTNTNT
jgi:hypothetical protein